MHLDNRKLIYRLTLFLVAVSGILCLFLLDRVYRDEVSREGEFKLTEATSTLQRRLALRLHHLTLVTADLRAFLLTRTGPQESDAFTRFAATLLQHYPELDALVYVGPDRIIREIYPLTGNEQAIGLDLSKRPTAPYIERAIHERRLIVDPPHLMSTGRLAVIARLPIYRDEEFLGLAQAILHVPAALNSELADMGSGFAVQLRDENGTLFWGEPRLEGRVVSREVMVGSGHWTLSVAAASHPALNNTIVVLIWGGGAVLLLSILASMRNYYRLSVALKAEVAETTGQLRSRNEELKQQLRQRLEAEAKVRRREKVLRETQQIAQLGSWEWDLSSGQILWSDELYRIFGQEPQAFVPTLEEFYARLHPGDLERVQQCIATTLEKDTPCEQDYRIIHADGSLHYVRGIGILERDTDGKPLRMTGSLQDISSQKQAILALEESERKYRAVLEYASDGILISTIDGQLLDANQRIQRLLGYSREELLKLHASQIHPPEDAEKLRAAFSSIRERGFSLFEHLLLRKDGSTIPVEVAGTLVTFGEQQIALGIFRDIRERKRIEAELHHYHHHLEQRSAELVALNGELEAFSYSVSHDLRAPLRAIHGFSEALAEDYSAALDETGRNYLERIQSSTMRMRQLIDDLLHLSRTVRTEMHWDNISLSQLVTELLQELHEADPARNVRSVVEPELNAEGDPPLIRSLLQNLLSNAWKFSRARDDALIEFGQTIRSGVPVFFVRDNGIGFEMSQACELYKPFHRLHGPTDYEGSGIGLATVQRIVQRHGGLIWAESEAGQGATFYFTLGRGVGSHIRADMLVANWR